jgi:hypothetical protein
MAALRNGREPAVDLTDIRPPGLGVYVWHRSSGSVAHDDGIRVDGRNLIPVIRRSWCPPG